MKLELIKTAAMGMGLAALVLLTVGGTASVTARPTGTDVHANLPATVTLTGVVRDFRELSVKGGHPDFELNASGGNGHAMGMVTALLDSEGKPGFVSSGYKVNKNWTDAQGRNIMRPAAYMATRPGDVAGELNGKVSGQITNHGRFQQWFRDVPGTNMSAPLSITLVRQAGTNTYTFNDKTDSLYANRGGFFPINGELFGNSGGTPANRNYHFTYELGTQFKYEKGKSQVFTFTGDDDVWVYIDGKLVIDIGGIHGSVSQTVELDRLTWLKDGGTYSLKFFFAERHRTQSNFRIDTTLSLGNAPLPATSAFWD